MKNRNDPSDGGQKKEEPQMTVLGHLAAAMKRFHASLNPKMSFGRREESEPEQEGAMNLDRNHTRSRSAPLVDRRLDRPATKRCSTGRLPFSEEDDGRKGGRRTPVHSTRGHMTSYLFAPLPSLKRED